MLKVTLVKSIIAAEPRNKKTVLALGLRKIGQSNTFEDSPSIRGMIHHVKHLLKVEEIEGGEVKRRRVVRGEQDAPAPVKKAAKAEPKAEATEAKPKAAAKAKKTDEDAPKAEAKPKKAPAKKKKEDSGE